MLESETKFVVGASHVRAATEWVRHVCERDPSFAEGIVSSIYFDTRDLRLLHEKLDSTYLKTKVRARWYTDPATGAVDEGAFLEVKQRVGSCREKSRVDAPLSGPELDRLDLEDPRLGEVGRTLTRAGVELGARLVPSMLIRYRRRRFIEPSTGARVCIDVDIEAPKVNRRLLPTAHLRRLRLAVVEVKGPDVEIPGPLHRLATLGCHRSSFSKYAACYETRTGAHA